MNYKVCYKDENGEYDTKVIFSELQVGDYVNVDGMFKVVRREYYAWSNDGDTQGTDDCFIFELEKATKLF